MKKIVLTLIISLLLLGLLACTAQNEADTTGETAVIDIATLAPEVDVQTAHALKDHEEIFLLDVREQWEYDAGHIPNITLIPMGEIPDRIAELPTDKEIIVTCRSGNRSGQITNFLREQGFTNVHNMQGGILAWEEAGFDVER